MKKTITKKLLAFIIMMMFSFTFVNAQCPGNKILVYKCQGGGRGDCVSKCVNPNHIPNGWSHGCPCLRSANEQADGELFTFAISPNPVSGSSVIYFFLEQSEKASLNIFDVNGKLISTLADKMFEEGEHQIEFNTEKLNAGIYFLKMQAGDFLKTEKLIITK